MSQKTVMRLNGGLKSTKLSQPAKHRQSAVSAVLKSSPTRTRRSTVTSIRRAKQAPVTRVVAAQTVHRGSRLPTTPSDSRFDPIAAMPEFARPASHQRDWAAVVLSGVLAIGFASIFLSPLWFTSRASTTAGLILGESISQPLTITVHVTMPDRSERLIVTPTSGALVESLARAAAADGQEFTYVSRGSSIYLDSFFGWADTRGGHWVIQVNGRTVTDFSQVELLQGDTVFTRWIPRSV